MRTRISFLLLAALLTGPSTLAAQSFAIGARIGTLGFGGEAALGVSSHFTLRGGLGSFFYEHDDEFDGVDYTITPPSLTGNLGVDFYPTGGPLRIMAGLMFRDGDFEAETGDLAEAGGVEIGDNTYTESGYLFGTVATRSTSPFVGLGFGNHTRGGFGFFIDLGVAFVGDPEVELRAEGEIATVGTINQDLEIEAQNIEDDYSAYLKYWPILNIGVKIPFT